MSAHPDPNRVGGLGWLAATGGRLSRSQRRKMLGISIATQRTLLVQRMSPRRKAQRDLSEAMLVPDTALVAEAVDVARTQCPEILGHAYRTAVFARALALIDGADVDPELLVVSGLLHDIGLESPVVGEDFTWRSAVAAADVAARAGRSDAAPSLQDAIVVHTTVGIDPVRDGALGFYTQAGAMVDLVGLRERHLPHDLVTRTVTEYPRSGLARRITRAIAAESRAVPAGRFAFLRRVGMGPAIRVAAVPSRP
jgi:hypothetical protein